MLRLELLGGLAVQGTRQIRGAAGQRKSLVLLALVAAAPSGISREKIAGFLWPDVSEHRAQNALRQRLFSLRRDLGEDELFLGTSILRLNPSVLSVDLWELEAALAAGDAERTTALYTGPFLDGIFVKEAPDIDRWIDEMRRDLTAKATRIFATAAAQAAQNGDHTRAVAAWRTLAGLDPTSSDFTIGLATSLARSGDTAGALKQIRHYSKLMRQQLDLGPDPRVVALAESIRAGGSTRAASDLPSPETNAARRSQESTANISELEPATLPRATASSPMQNRFRSTYLFAAGSCLVAVALYGAHVYRERSANRMQTRRVLVLPFRNETGSDSLDALANAAATAISERLTRVDIVDVIDGREALGDTRFIAGSTPPDNIAQRLRAGTTIMGAFRLEGNEIVSQAAMVDTRSGAILQVTRDIRAHRDSTFRLLEQLGLAVAGAVSAMRDPVFVDATGARVNPPNLGAYREFVRGIYELSRYAPDSAYHNFRRAVDLDSGFVEASLWAATVAPDDSIRFFLDRVKGNASPLTPLEKTRFDYLSSFTDRDMDAAYEASLAMVRLAPSSSNAQSIHAYAAFSTQRYGTASRAYLRVDPDAPAYHGLAWEAHHMAGEHRRALIVAEEGMHRHSDNVTLCANTLPALVAVGRNDEIDKRIDECARRSTEGMIQGYMEVYSQLAPELFVHGSRDRARAMWNELVRLAEQLAEKGAISRENLGASYYEAARYQDALPLLLEAAERRSAGGPLLMRVAVSAAMTGDTATSSRFASMIKQRRAQSQARYPHAILARIAVAQGKPDEAMSLLSEFGRSGGLVARQTHAERIFEPLWARPEWKALTSSRD